MLLKPMLSAAILALTMLASACGGPPKQAEVADDTKETGVDMAGSEAGEKPVAEGAPSEGGAEMHAKCCELCKEGLAKDRTGAAPSTIPCADFTDTMTPWCLEHFRGKPTMADACK